MLKFHIAIPNNLYIGDIIGGHYIVIDVLPYKCIVYTFHHSTV